MSHYDQNQAPVAYPAPGSVYPPPPPQSYPPRVEGFASGPYVAPPPAGYPMKGSEGHPQQPPHGIETKKRGFWKGCCAGMCCCFALDICF